MPRAIHNVVADIERRYGTEGTAAIAARMRAQAHRLRIARECPTALDLAERCDPGLIRTPALEVVNARIHEAMNTRDGRLIVSMPPQSGKSNLVQWAIAGRLRDNPEGRIGYASYAKWLARRGGRTVRDRIEAHMAPGLRIRRDHRDASDWQIDGHNGGMYSVGVEGGFTGQPVDEGLVVDDPIKDLQDAQSPAVIQNLFDWWSTVAQTRVWAGAWIIIIQTRWTEHELASVLIGEGWPWVNIPAEADPSIPDALGRPPGVFLDNIQGMDPEGWRKKRADVGEITWFAMYQGVPSPPKGDTFKLEWFNRDRVLQRPTVGHPPLVFVDPADNPGDGDEAGILVASKGADQDLYLGPDYSDHYTVGRWIRVALLAVARHGASGIVFEQSLSGLTRSIQKGWEDLRKQALILRGLGVTDCTPLDPDIIERGVAQLAHEHDPTDTVDAYRAELIELWPLVDAVLAFTPAGPQVMRIKPRGSKEWRAKAASPAYERRDVHHVGYLAQLEHQMATWKVGQKSPDRMDTAVHAILHLSGATPAELVRPEGRELPTRSTRSGLGRSMVLPRSTMTGRR